MKAREIRGDLGTANQISTTSCRTEGSPNWAFRPASMVQCLLASIRALAVRYFGEAIATLTGVWFARLRCHFFSHPSGALPSGQLRQLESRHDSAKKRE